MTRHANTLSKREQEVMRLVVKGCTNKEIASALGIAEHTVEHHLTHVFQKLGAATRTEAVLHMRLNMADLRH